MRSLPLADRCWELFCAGKSYAAIGRMLDIDRETAARHVKAIHKEVQAERRADRALALSRALATQQRIQATAWDLLALAQARLTAQETAPSSSSSVSSASSVVKSPSSSFADCARLLNIILASARETARLELLYDKDAPARRTDQGPPEPVHIIIERVGDPYAAPTQPSPSPPKPPTGCDATSSAPPDEEGLGQTSMSSTIPPTQPAPATAVAPPAGTPTPPTPAPSSSPIPTSDGGMGGKSASAPTPTWISLGDGSMVWGTPAPPSGARSAPSELGNASGVRPPLSPWERGRG